MRCVRTRGKQQSGHKRQRVRIQSNAPSNSLGGQQHVFPRVQLVGIRVLPVEVLAHGFGGELGLADVAEVSGKVHGLAWAERGRESTWGAHRNESTSNIPVQKMKA